MKNEKAPPALQETAPSVHAVPTAPTEDADDAEVCREAARHREHAQAMVREHLQNHASHNPGRSSDYVTWIATLHPENADIAIDQRFFVPGNPWWTIYEETKKNSEIPVADAIPVTNSPTKEEDDDIEGGTLDTTLDTSKMCTSDGEGSDDDGGGGKEKSAHCCQTCNPIALFFGLVLSVVSFVIVLCYELISLLLCHLPAALFYHAGQAFAPPNICTCFLYMTFMIVFCAFSFADSMLLLASVLVTECLALAALVVGFLTGGCLWANHLQQHIRKLCHGIRVVFRKKTSSPDPTAQPPRGILCCGQAPDEHGGNDRRKQNPNLEGVRVINVQRVRLPTESCH